MAQPRANTSGFSEQGSNLQILLGDKQKKFVDRVKEYINTLEPNKVNVALEFVAVTGINGLDRVLDNEKIMFTDEEKKDPNRMKLKKSKEKWVDDAIQILLKDKEIPPETWECSKSFILLFIEKLKNNAEILKISAELDDFFKWEKINYANDSLFSNGKDNAIKSLILSALVFNISGRYTTNALRLNKNADITQLSRESEFLKKMGPAYAQKNPYAFIMSGFEHDERIVPAKKDIINLCNKTTFDQAATLTKQLQTFISKYCIVPAFFLLPDEEKINLLKLLKEDAMSEAKQKWTPEEQKEIQRNFDACIEKYRNKKALTDKHPELLSAMKIIERTLGDARFREGQLDYGDPNLDPTHKKHNEESIKKLTQSDDNNSVNLGISIERYQDVMRKSLPECLKKLEKQSSEYNSLSQIINAPDLFQLYMDFKMRKSNPTSPIAQLLADGNKTKPWYEPLMLLESALNLMIKAKVGNDVAQQLKGAFSALNQQESKKEVKKQEVKTELQQPRKSKENRENQQQESQKTTTSPTIKTTISNLPYGKDNSSQNNNSHSAYDAASQAMFHASPSNKPKKQSEIPIGARKVEKNESSEEPKSNPPSRRGSNSKN